MQANAYAQGARAGSGAKLDYLSWGLLEWPCRTCALGYWQIIMEFDNASARNGTWLHRSETLDGKFFTGSDQIRPSKSATDCT